MENQADHVGGARAVVPDPVLTDEEALVFEGLERAPDRPDVAFQIGRERALRDPGAAVVMSTAGERQKDGLQSQVAGGLSVGPAERDAAHGPTPPPGGRERERR